MRFRPANISLINRRLYLPRLRLTLSLKQKTKTPTDLQLLTGSHHISSCLSTIRPEPNGICVYFGGISMSSRRSGGNQHREKGQQR